MAPLCAEFGISRKTNRLPAPIAATIVHPAIAPASKIGRTRCLSNMSGILILEPPLPPTTHRYTHPLHYARMKHFSSKGKA